MANPTPKAKVLVRCWLFLEPVFEEMGGALRNVKVVKVTSIKPNPKTSSVSSGSMILELNLKVDADAFEFPILAANIESAAMKPEAIIKELQEWVGNE